MHIKYQLEKILTLGPSLQLLKRSLCLNLVEIANIGSMIGKEKLSAMFGLTNMKCLATSIYNILINIMLKWLTTHCREIDV